MKLKDLIGISLVSVFLFPVVLIGIMLASGVAHLEFGDGKDKELIKEAFTAADQLTQADAEARQLKAFKAAEAKEKELADRQAQVDRDIERIEALKAETDKARAEIAKERARIEELVGKNSEINDKQLASLAEVYGGMRPEEAAPILLSLDDPMVVRILKKIPETRATSKLMAALAALDVKRAARLTSLLGGKGAVKTAPAKEAAKDAPKAKTPATEDKQPTAPAAETDKEAPAGA